MQIKITVTLEGDNTARDLTNMADLTAAIAHAGVVSAEERERLIDGALKLRRQAAATTQCQICGGAGKVPRGNGTTKPCACRRRPRKQAKP